MILKIALAVSIVICIYLLIRLLLVKSSIRELTNEFTNRSLLNTNAKIGISSRDADLCALARRVNDMIGELRERYHRYAQGDDEMKRAITNISHDLRTPLTAICGYIELMKKDGLVISDEAKEYLKVVESRALYMKELTEELFEYSKIAEEESEELTKEEVSLNRALEDCLMDYYGALTEKGIEPGVSISEKVFTKQLNRRAVDRILANLMSNSLKYSRGDLKVTLDDTGVITFRNFAPLVDSLDAERLFDRFYTVETGKQSTGLGLSIAKLLTEKMGGTITARKEEDYLIIELCL